MLKVCEAMDIHLILRRWFFYVMDNFFIDIFEGQIRPTLIVSIRWDVDCDLKRLLDFELAIFHQYANGRCCEYFGQRANTVDSVGIVTLLLPLISESSGQ